MRFREFGKSKEQDILENSESQYQAARYVMDYADGDTFYVKGTPEVIKQFVVLANSLEAESAEKGGPYEPGVGAMSQLHRELGQDTQPPQWEIVDDENLEQIKPIDDRTLAKLRQPDLSYGVEEFMSEFLNELQRKKQALMTDSYGNLIEETITETIRKLPNGKYRLYSGKGRNLGTFDSRDAAEKHERQVQYFKHR